MARKDKHGTRYEKKMVKTGTDQFVVLGGEFGEPLVKLQHGYYGDQIPEERRKRSGKQLNTPLHPYYLILQSDFSIFCIRE